MNLGWDQHGHAIPSGTYADRWLGSGALQDAENCNYDPSNVLAEMPVDESRFPAYLQYREGEITLTDGAVLRRGGTLNSVWAVTYVPPALAILNTSILTTDGTYTLQTITVEEARKLVDAAPRLDSAVGHTATAALLSDLLGVDIPVNRQEFVQQPGQGALVLKLHGRPPEGVVLDRQAMDAIGWSLKLLVRTA